MSTLKLITLNVEGDKHLDLVRSFIQKEDPDVICLQEVFEIDFNDLKQFLEMDGKFTPIVNIAAPNKIQIAPRGNFGNAILSKYPITAFYQEFYQKYKESVPYFDDTDPNCTDRVLLATTITKNNLDYKIATTHFAWSDNGQATDFQHQSLDRLFKILEKVGDCVLCGDFNAPRGGEIYTRISQKFTDNTPPDTITTLDKNIHRVKNIPSLVVDYVFTSKTYLAQDTKIVDGVSDHMAIVTSITKIEL